MHVMVPAAGACLVNNSIAVLPGDGSCWEREGGARCMLATVMCWGEEVFQSQSRFLTCVIVFHGEPTLNVRTVGSLQQYLPAWPLHSVGQQAREDQRHVQ